MTFTDRKPLRRAVFAAALLASLGVATTARAADAGKDERMPRTYAAMMKMQPVEVMHVMDQGGKGYVTREEFMKFYEKVFQSMDKDRNGKLTEPEFTDRG